MSAEIYRAISNADVEAAFNKLNVIPFEARKKSGGRLITLSVTRNFPFRVELSDLKFKVPIHFLNCSFDSGICIRGIAAAVEIRFKDCTFIGPTAIAGIEYVEKRGQRFVSVDELNSEAPIERARALGSLNRRLTFETSDFRNSDLVVEHWIGSLSISIRAEAPNLTLADCVLEAFSFDTGGGIPPRTLSSERTTFLARDGFAFGPASRPLDAIYLKNCDFFHTIEFYNAQFQRSLLSLLNCGLRAPFTSVNSKFKKIDATGTRFYGHCSVQATVPEGIDFSGAILSSSTGQDPARFQNQFAGGAVLASHLQAKGSVEVVLSAADSSVSFDDASVDSDLTFQFEQHWSGLALDNVQVGSNLTLSGTENAVLHGTFSANHIRCAGLSIQGLTFAIPVAFRSLKADRVRMATSGFSRGLCFDDADIGDLVAVGTEIAESLSFRYARFTGLPSFGETVLPQDTTFGDAIFREHHSSRAEAIYRSLRLKFSEHHNHVEEVRFGALEQTSRWLATYFAEGRFWEGAGFREKFARPARGLLRGLWANKADSLFSFLYWMANGFGASIGRPFLWWLVMLVVAGHYYSAGYRNDSASLQFDSSAGGEVISRSWLYDLKGNRGLVCYVGFPVVDSQPVLARIPFAQPQSCAFDVRGFVFSIFSSLGPFRLLPEVKVLVGTTWKVQAASIVQAVFSTLLLFLGALGVRKRYRLKD